MLMACLYAAPPAVDQYLAPAPELSSKPAALAAAVIDGTDRQSGGRTDTRPF